MRRSTLAILFFFLLAGAGIFALSASVFHAVASKGTMNIRARSDHESVRVSVPAAFAEAILAGPLLIHDHIEFHADPELEEILPALAAAIDDLENYENVPLVEVIDDHHSVRIEKSGARFRIEVRDHGDLVQISLPEKTVKKIVARYRATGGRSI